MQGRTIQIKKKTRSKRKPFFISEADNLSRPATTSRAIVVRNHSQPTLEKFDHNDSHDQEQIFGESQVILKNYENNSALDLENKNDSVGTQTLLKNLPIKIPICSAPQTRPHTVDNHPTHLKTVDLFNPESAIQKMIRLTREKRKQKLENLLNPQKPYEITYRGCRIRQEYFFSSCNENENKKEWENIKIKRKNNT